MPPPALVDLELLIANELFDGVKSSTVRHAGVRAALVGTARQQDFRLARYKKSYGGRLENAAHVAFATFFSVLGKPRRAALLAEFCTTHGSLSPSLSDLKDEFFAFGSRAEPTLVDLLRLDRTVLELFESLSPAPRLLVTPEHWLNPNLRLLRSKHMLDALWIRRSGSSRSLWRSSLASPKQQTFAVLLTPSGPRVERLSKMEAALVSPEEPMAKMPSASVVASLAERALLIRRAK